MEKIFEIGYIYKLICSETGDCYYGSTINPVKRFARHRQQNNTCKSKGLIKPTMHIMEMKKNISKNDLQSIEKYYILNNNCVNKNVPKRTYKEWYKQKIIDNPNYQKEKYQKYEGKSRNERTRKHCECGGKYIQRNLKIHLLTNKHIKYVNTI